LLVNSVKGTEGCNAKKRGYILDRNFTPIALSVVKYKAYYLLDGGPIPKVVRAYLGNTLNLPEKGSVLISNDLTPDEVKKLSHTRRVVIEKQFQRHLLQPYLRFLIGETFGGEGISGIEKAFDNRLKQGKVVVLSIDLSLEKKLYSLARRLEPKGFAAAVFNVCTGEVLGYIDTGTPLLFDSFYPVKLFGIRKKLPNFKWELYDTNLVNKGGIQRINLWYLAKLYMDSISASRTDPTILFKNVNLSKACKPLETGFVQNFSFPNGTIKVLSKGNKLAIVILKGLNQSKSAKEVANYLETQVL